MEEHSKSWMEEEVAANNIGGGQIAKFDPLFRVARKKKMTDLVRRWMQGR